MQVSTSQIPESATAWLEPTWIASDFDGNPAALAALLDRNHSLDPTTSTLDNGSSSRHGPLAVRVVGAGERDAASDPFALLRSRLSAAAWVLLAGMGLLFCYEFATYQLTPQGLEAGTLVVMIGSAVLLTGSRPLNKSQLRVLELALFGVTGVQLLNTQLDWLTRFSIDREATEVMWAACAGPLAFGVLVLSYGLFMPNGWRRTAIMLFPPAIAPIAAIAFVRLWDRFAMATISVGRLSELTVYMLGVWGVAVYGTRTIATLRQEYRQALRFGQYRLREKIGSGGMGEVYLAEHRLLKRPCALKLVRPNRTSDPQSLIRFEREVRATAQLSHWNTVEIYDYGHTDDGTFYYVMEYLPGLNLSELVRRFGPMCPERVVHFLVQTCDALAEAHSIGLIHRDLKPANIFAAQRGGAHDVTKLLDFGLVMDDARSDMLLAPEPLNVNSFAGSPLYMAPEQMDWELPPDPRSDLYSLGATGYCLLTGHPPFEGKSPLRLMMAHARDPVVPPSRFEANIPQDLEDIILRCLEKHPSRRYTSVIKLREALLNCSVAGRWTQDRAAQWWQSRAAAVLVHRMEEDDRHINPSAR